MKRLAAVIGLTLVFLGLTILVAEEQIGFSGTWVLDSKESDPFPRPIMDLNAGGGDVSMGGRGGGMGGMGGGMGGMGGGMGGGMPGGKAPGSKGPQQQTPVPMVIQQTEGEMQITNTVNSTPMVEKFKCDGKEAVEMVPVPGSQNPQKRVTKATLKKNEFQVNQKTQIPNGTSEVKKKYSLSKDGKTLTVNIKTTMTMSMRMPGGPPTPAMVTQTVQKLVYDRQ